jgi:hypothetical protein
MSDEKTSLDLAYELAVESYDPLVKRLDIMDGRLQAIMSFAATTMALVPSVASARNLSFRSFWFWAAFTVFVLILLLGVQARHYGEVILINPKKLATQDWLELETKDFKKFFIEYASTHWEKNNSLITWKWNKAVFLSILFFLQVGLLVAWMAVLRL